MGVIEKTETPYMRYINTLPFHATFQHHLIITPKLQPYNYKTIRTIQHLLYQRRTTQNIKQYTYMLIIWQLQTFIQHYYNNATLLPLLYVRFPTSPTTLYTCMLQVSKTSGLQPSKLGHKKSSHRLIFSLYWFRFTA